jgi:putative ABC transport system permease protein
MRLPRPSSIKDVPVRLRVLWGLYVWRVQQHAAQELMACVGIAVGVALFFGVLVAGTSVTGSAPALIRQIVGSARFALTARSPEGFNGQVAEAVRKLPGVQVASPILKAPAILVGPKGRQPIQLIGVTPSIIGLGSEATRDLGAGAQLLAGGLGLPAQVADEVGAQPRQTIMLLVGGTRHTVLVRDVLGTQTIGAVANSPVAVALLPAVQQLTGNVGRVTQVLVRPRPGADQLVLRELSQLAAGRLEVVPADNELRLLQEAAKPSNQSTRLFAFIGAMVGFLLALNAVLITTPERRRFTAEMRSLGFTRRFIVVILAFQAAILGMVGSVLGIGLGILLAQTLFHQAPGFLATAFLLGAHQTVHATTVLFAVGCGLLAAFGSLVPSLADLRSDVTDAVLRDPGEAGQVIATRTMLRIGVVGVALIGVVTALALTVPDITIFSGALLAIAGLCLIPVAYLALVWALTRASYDLPGSTLPITVAELEATATRSVVLAGIVALAVYGSVAVGGAQHDLLGGLDRAVVQAWSTAQIWVTPDGNIFDANSFHTDDTLATLARTPGIAAVLVHQGGFLDIGQHRLWIRATPPNNSTMVLSSQLLQGNLALATARLREHGWVTVSSGFASEHHLRVGGSFTLPTPSGTARFNVAAITTNIGWPSGTITINTDDYARYWQTTDPTTLAINLKPGMTPQAGKEAVARALGHGRGLRVQSSEERIAEVQSTIRQGLRSLGEIANLLLIAAALAVATALGTAIWQRRTLLASLKAQGFDSWQLWRAILAESATLLVIGCVTGTILGVYGHALASHWLVRTTGFPAPFSLAWVQILATLGLVMSIALVVIALPGFQAARVPARESFQE